MNLNTHHFPSLPEAAGLAFVLLYALNTHHFPFLPEAPGLVFALLYARS
jgi:hypothetical protein